jgi:hypothetical protein
MRLTSMAARLRWGQAAPYSLAPIHRVASLAAASRIRFLRHLAQRSFPLAQRLTADALRCNTPQRPPVAAPSMVPTPIALHPIKTLVLVSPVGVTAPFYWTLDAGGGLSGGSYTFTVVADNVPGVNNASQLRIVKRPTGGGPWNSDGTFASSSLSGNTVTIITIA